MSDLSILDGSIADLREKAANLPLHDLLALLGAEQGGKTRKGAIAALEELIAASTIPAAVVEGQDADDEPVADDEPPGSVVEIVPGHVLFTNDTDATCIHLGDGRKLAPGESASVSPELYAILKPEPAE